VVAFVNENEQARQTIRNIAQRVAEAMRDEAGNEGQLTLLLGDYRAALEAETARRARAIKTLDAKINFSTTPRLDALLLLAGVTGDASIMGNMGGRPGPGRFGGPGGADGFGGPGGGPGRPDGGGGRRGGRGGRGD